MIAMMCMDKWSPSPKGFIKAYQTSFFIVLNAFIGKIILMQTLNLYNPWQFVMHWIVTPVLLIIFLVTQKYDRFWLQMLWNTIGSVICNFGYILFIRLAVFVMKFYKVKYKSTYLDNISKSWIHGLLYDLAAYLALFLLKGISQSIMWCIDVKKERAKLAKEVLEAELETEEDKDQQDDIIN